MEDGYRLWKVFEYQGRELFAYTQAEEFEDEEEATLGLLAYENHCRVESIHVHTEMRRDKCQV